MLVWVVVGGCQWQLEVFAFAGMLMSFEGELVRPVSVKVLGVWLLFMAVDVELIVDEVFKYVA